MQPTQVKDTTQSEAVLAVSLELAKGSWKIALHDGLREKPAVYTVSDAHALERLEAAIGVIEMVRGRGADRCSRIVVSYEAGQDGFWIYRALTARGYEVLIIDPASIPVERHARRAKTDRLDAIKLVMALRGWLRGERDRMHVIRVPSVAQEDARQQVRDRGELQKEIQQHRDRIRKLLRTAGCWESVRGDVEERLAHGEYRCYDGTPLPAVLVARLKREAGRLALVQRQLEDLEALLTETLPPPMRVRIAQLAALKGVGDIGARRLVLELFWRDFNNRREVGACVGLVPQPYDSGAQRVDQGISRQGNRRVRALLIEMAWCWLRYQPTSELARWFAQRTCGSGPNKRVRRIAIVAVARRLVIALWRYLQNGTLPSGARVKTA